MVSEAENIFEKIEKERGGVAKIHTAFSDFPKGISAHYYFYNALILSDDLPLARGEREFIAYRTSEENNCPYCTGHHKAAFKTTQIELDAKIQDILGDFSRIISKEPWKSSLFKDIFLSNGFTEAQFQHAVMVASYFNFVNRCAFAMGLDLEDGFEKMCN